MIRIITSSRYIVDKKRIRLFVASFFAKKGIDSEIGINIIFVGKTKMRHIASTYKHEDVALPVLAFPYKNDKDVGESLLGEIFLCYPQVVLLAAEKGKRLNVLIDGLIEHGMQNLLK